MGYFIFGDGMFSDGMFGDGMFSDRIFSDGMFSDGTFCMKTSLEFTVQYVRCHGDFKKALILNNPCFGETKFHEKIKKCYLEWSQLHMCTL